MRLKTTPGIDYNGGVHEILEGLSRNAFVLDLGSGPGSFDADASRAGVVRVDLEKPSGSLTDASFIQADSKSLPFREAAFDAAVCNHSLEHFVHLKDSLSELERVISRNARLFVSLPDSSSPADRIYRRLFCGGGHVNPFCSADEIVQELSEHVGLECVAVRPLCASFSFLNSKNRKGKPHRRLLYLLGNERLLVLFNYLLRTWDRLLSQRASRYGWAVYFGSISTVPDTATCANVCVRCGSGHPSDWLIETGAVFRRFPLIRGYSCPRCGTLNLFTPDEGFSHYT